MKNFNAIIPILMHLFTCFIFIYLFYFFFFFLKKKKTFFLLKTASAVSCVKPNTNQWKATLYDDVGIPTVIRRIYRGKFLALSNQTSCYIRKCIRIEGILNVMTFFCHLYRGAVGRLWPLCCTF